MQASEGGDQKGLKESMPRYLCQTTEMQDRGGKLNGYE